MVSFRCWTLDKSKKYHLSADLVSFSLLSDSRSSEKSGERRSSFFGDVQLSLFFVLFIQLCQFSVALRLAFSVQNIDETGCVSVIVFKAAVISEKSSRNIRVLAIFNNHEFIFKLGCQIRA